MAEVDVLFERFWAVYPRRTAKLAARKAWNKLRPTDDLLSTIREALDQQTRTIWAGKSKEFIPHAATWLNGHRWEDEPWEDVVRTTIYDWTCPHEAPKCRARSTCDIRSRLAGKQVASA